MDQNFTPLTEDQKAKHSKLKIFLLIIGVLTAIILGVVLFLLIQQKMREQDTLKNQYVPTQVQPTRVPPPLPSPTQMPLPTTEAPVATSAPLPATGGAVLTTPTVLPSP